MRINTNKIKKGFKLFNCLIVVGSLSACTTVYVQEVQRSYPPYIEPPIETNYSSTAVEVDSKTTTTDVNVKLYENSDSGVNY